ncbi:MAG: outer membrane beta-barrel protein [Betaproteobacteria bacterium]|nr:outer membrane beta-barrel protein [Betaproteobacteria bacterium]
MKTKALVCALAALTLGTIGAAQAGDFVVKLGIADVVPKSDNGTLNGVLKTDVGISTRPSITLEYLFTPNLGVEVLGAWPFRNDIRLNGLKLARVDVLPPTVSLQWHFLPKAPVSPFVGAGVNYTFMYNEKTKGQIAKNKLDIENSWGFAAHAGVDFNFSKNWLMTLDARWIQMRNDVKVDGAKVGKVKIDPMVWGVAVGYRF